MLIRQLAAYSFRGKLSLKHLYDYIPSNYNIPYSLWGWGMRNGKGTCPSAIHSHFRSLLLEDKTYHRFPKQLNYSTPIPIFPAPVTFPHPGRPKAPNPSFTVHFQALPTRCGQSSSSGLLPCGQVGTVFTSYPQSPSHLKHNF